MQEVISASGLQETSVPLSLAILMAAEPPPCTSEEDHMWIPVKGPPLFLHSISTLSTESPG